MASGPITSLQIDGKAMETVADFILGGSKITAGIKIAGRDINNLRYADDTTLMAESKEELKSLFAGVQPQWIQGIRRGDGFGDQDTIALIKY